MDLPEIPPFRKKDPPPHSNNNHASAAPSSTTTVTTAPSSTINPPSSHCNNNHDPVTPLSTSAPPSPYSDDGHFDVAPANSNQVPKASQPHEAPQTQPYVPLQSEETMEEEQAPFVPSMGAWSKPLSQIENFWPSLGESTNFTKKNSLLKVPSSLNLPVKKLPPPELKEDGSLRFPWAARMNPTTRNLYRASRPTFRLDGTPEIIIPTKNCVTPKVPESTKAKNITSELPDLVMDQILGQELGLQKTVLTPQHVPFQFGKPGESSPDIYTSPATTKSMSLQVAIPQKDSSTTFGKSSLDTKFTLSSTLADTSSAHTSLQAMDDVPSEIIMNEGNLLATTPIGK
ncbi:hypothetical protein HID58_049443 [Brassica napus]|uniref:Uncharacterized protein n=1 Tax=Brassica napus TaxID=3708 RepID=A0ABQ8B6L2_BRANA|nr:hypothetical protein HID58_049443 [Brassica napus]